MRGPDNTCSFAEFQRNTKEHIQRLKRTGKAEVLTIKGRTAVVVQSPKAYQKLIEGAEELRTLQILRRSLKEAKRGKGRPAREVLREIADQHGVEIPQ